ncbi:bifunctional phosphoribosylaminoimidazolecarboxamide formyltransferase/IMP cyclohydrolase [Deinococcus wulumuqiensis]|uniref:Bifunctional purine biosynthesis protein PurH n=1 Tax=Deinococcus wulumuqiensis TaxID=980427 RepID=A0AAV4K4H3_9DEIO|nr:bifunctional phosphoribosylaminoimidazolecarboxamide formyltransferase/IMP cyclohydrolase [Deinococcus wulumuqiensis]QII20662.1 bifunctional phosphoribosylaminoimidazolecarboxamide formyltransferase/IMP cyclohydrolase [Deinococcus wulumuqiensis R12]GGI73236.1 bifunctional purine biosynthesis protein PurH [Deinococcus wulumuqiensis]GGP28624.1 bifunctional purine biosynthesis protein PurH [Deinococcus wulumuqiensis]
MATKRALLSVSDKTGIVEFAQELQARGWELLSTGGTFAALQAAGVSVTQVSDVTGFPEMMDGRVKTLHPAIHGGILARRGTAHMDELAAQSFGTIDLVCVNLYPFRETVARGAPDPEVIENIDIGGPAMIRSAAKNHEAVLILVDPADYALALQDEVSQADRRRLAAKAYGHTSGYDAAITAYLSGESDTIPTELPQTLDLHLTRVAQVRYGENPHQPGAIYRWGNARGPVIDAQVVAGKPMSFNNYADADAAWSLCQELAAQEQGAVCVAVKHANPCGVAVAENVATAWERARDADTLSVFGGVVAVSQPVDFAAAQSMKGTFLEVLIAPDVTPDAVEWFAAKKPDLRVLIAGQSEAVSVLDVRPLAGGFAVQERDRRPWDDLCPEVVTGRQPTEQEWDDLRFAWAVVKGARSNAVAICKGGVTVGLGAGAVSRIWAAERAVQNAGEGAQGAVLASEAFFPFDDVVRLAAAAGVTAILQPGGAKRDPEVIAACNELGISMVFTGSRHFRH